MSESGFRDDFRRNFLTGIAALFPILVTLFLLAWFYRQVDATIGSGMNALCRQLLARYPGLFNLFFPAADAEALATFQARHQYAAEHFPRVVGVLVGLLVTALIVYVLGKFLRGYIGERLMRAVDRLFTRFPLIKAIYPHARQVADFVFGQRQRRAFRDVVAVEYPRRGVYSLGFLTGRGLKQVKSELGQELVTVFVPTSPTPLTGFVILLPSEQVIKLKMSVDEAFRYFITAGMLSSDEEGLEPSALAELPGVPDQRSD